MNRLSCAVVALAVLLATGAAGARETAKDAAVKHGGQRASALVSGTPGDAPVVNTKTHTLYVPIQCQVTCNHAQDNQHLLDLIDIATCSARTVSQCHVTATAEAGKGAVWAAIDPKTDTLYVADASGAVTVVDGAHCNASVRTRCRRPLATIPTGGFNVADVLNPRTHTLYVAALSGSVYVVDVARCNSRTTRGCRQHVRRIKDTLGPDGIDVDVATDTVYVANAGGDASGHTVWVIDGAGCNGTTGRGCGRRPPSIAVGANPFTITVDQRTDTIYVPSDNDGTVSVINGARCNATVSSGCHRRARTVATGAGAAQVLTDPSRHTAFTVNQGDDTISEFSTVTCNGHRQSGCPTRARNEQATFNPPSGFNPNGFALVPRVGTAYLVNAGGEPFLAAVSITRSNALNTSGCRGEAPSVAADGVFPDLDPATQTIYAANGDRPGIQVLNARTCGVGGQCAPVATIPFAHPEANLGAIDPLTHTLYAADTNADYVSAIDIQHCNAHDTSGCSASAPKVKVGSGPSVPQLDQATRTLYVPEGKNHSDQIAVVNAATCNAQNASGCGQPPAVVHVGLNTYVIAVSQATNTVYAAVLGPDFNGNTVWVIDGATCNATDRAGCSHIVEKTKVGSEPTDVKVNEATHTLYVPNNGNGDVPGTVSVIDVAKCNGTVTTGCSTAWPVVSTGRSPVTAAIDPQSNRIFVADFSSAAVSVIDGSRCDAADARGCSAPARLQAVGSEPGNLIVDHPIGRVYVTERGTEQQRRWSIFPTSP